MRSPLSLLPLLVFLLAADSADRPSGRPYDITRDPATKKPQIVPAVHQDQLYVAWHGWEAHGPGNTIAVAKVALDQLTNGRLTAVRTVASPGVLVGFTVDATGADHILSARAEEFPNRPTGAFEDEVHKRWRKNAFVLYTRGKATDLNSPKFTDLPFYGLTSGGSGRLVAGKDHLAAVFARRRYSPGDHLIHQEANDLLVSRDLATVALKAGNTVSHSFDQRLLFDGTDFVVLHQGDTYPYAGLIIEKLHVHPAGKRRISRFLAYACPTFGNAVYFELGGLAAEPAGYPVLFTATRNQAAVREENQGSMHHLAWDLAMVYVVRDFGTKLPHPNPYNITGSGILAVGYAPDDVFTVDNFTWNPQTSRYDRPEPRTIKRRVLWLTDHGPGTRATRAKLVKLRDGHHVALWEEHTLVRNQWRYATTRALAITSSGGTRNKVITKGRQVELKGLRLHQGDDAVLLTLHGVPHAAWVTAGASARQLLVHTLDAELVHRSYPLTLPD